MLLIRHFHSLTLIHTLTCVLFSTAILSYICILNLLLQDVAPRKKVGKIGVIFDFYIIKAFYFQSHLLEIFASSHTFERCSIGEKEMNQHTV